MSSVSIARENPNPTPNRNPGLFLPRFIHDSFYSTIFSFLLLSFPFSLPLPTTPSPPASSHPPMPPFLARRTAASFPHAPPHNLHPPPPSVLAVAVTEGGVFGWLCARRRGQGRGGRGGPSCAPRPIRRSRTVPEPVMEEYSEILPVGDIGEYELLPMPKVEELGYGDISQEEISPFRGGETEALKRMRESLQDKEWVAKFEKPKGDPSAFLKPATTALSSYLKFGCLSSRYFYHCIQDVCRTARKHTKPPVSLTGQLLWRDFFYTVSFGTPNFDCMKGNKICKQIPWRENEELFVAWRDGWTGYPWIDAIMIQLKKWGWMHHLARHSVPCFLTRGDLEKGRDIFERLLIDSDWAINNDNWLWLSCSSFFYQYHRIYSPISFGKKYDPNRNYIRHFIPVLKGTHQQHFSTRKQLLCDFKTHPKR